MSRGCGCEGFFFQTVNDRQECVGVGIFEGVVDVLLDAVSLEVAGILGCNGIYRDQLLEDWLKVLE